MTESVYLKSPERSNKLPLNSLQLFLYLLVSCSSFHSIAVLPPSNKVAAIPNDATVNAMALFDRILARISKII
jgi:hypothetical protein